ncbi:MAG: FHA domain-containing protein [Rhodothermaceae bacterium]|nr:FHA domain-containing protein [Rhodothermaceae bacterium]
MQIHLTWQEPDSDVHGEWTGDLPLTLGRTTKPAIDHPQVTREHARLDWVDGQLILTDLESRNGTFVADEQVDRAELGASGTFRLGPVVVEVQALLPEPEETVIAPEPPELIETIAAPEAVEEPGPVDTSGTVEEPDAAPEPVEEPAEEPAEAPSADAGTLIEGEMTDSFATVEEAEPIQAAKRVDEPPRLVVVWKNEETGAEGQSMEKVPVALGSRDDSAVRLADARVSRLHATLMVEDGQIVLRDEQSSNGTFIGSEQVSVAQLGTAGQFTIRPFLITARIEGVEAESAEVREPATQLEEEASIFFDDERGTLAPAPPAEESGFPPALFQQDMVSVSALQATGVPIEEKAYVAIGGGLGSFIWVDYLRVYGVPTEGICVVGLEAKPHGRYERLCINSQIPYHERLRSDSASRPDCLWGWPGYAVVEAWNGITGRGNLKDGLRAAWKIFAEPTFTSTYTPVSGVVFDSIDKEARRIGWEQMRQHGRVKAIRKTDDGRYAVAYTVPGDTTDQRHRIVIARYVHVAVGYPGIRLLPDLQAYRIETGDLERVVNAYEEHQHVYDTLAREGGLVLIRGWGIVASRIIQRLFELRRDKGADVQILHLTRSIVAEGHRYRNAQRKVDNNWEFQPFNWPKAAWGGDLRFLLEESSPEERGRLLQAWGGTTTADREDWSDLIAQGRREGWYHIREGEVDRVERNAEGTLTTVIRGKKTLRAETRLDTNYIIDCTGLQSGIESHPLLRDLVAHHGLGRNVQGRLDVADDFEIRGMRNQQARMYASGVATLGGPYAPVDSFLGLQYAAQRSVNALVYHRAPRLQHLGALTSFGQWRRWARGVAP